jgi:putative transcription factor
MSYCELCGHQTLEKRRVVADGAVLNVCIPCSKHAKPYVPAQVAAKKKKKNNPPLAPKPQKKIGLADETVLTPNFARAMREARMRMGLTHEQLGMKMNEKAQLLKKFETGALKPDEMLAKKLERHLGIKLYVSANGDDEEE